MNQAVTTRDRVGTLATLLEQVDFFRLDAFAQATPSHRSEFGQFATPLAIASFMAAMFDARTKPVRLLDAGAGVGSLTAAFVAEMGRREMKPAAISATLFEVDPNFAGYLDSTVELCAHESERAGIQFDATVSLEDFTRAAVGMLDGEMFRQQRFDCAILNPPYRKINTDSETRRLLRQAGIETSNLYAAFLALAIALLDDGGELVAITPRSFCNGPYFRPFRRLLLDAMDLRRVHVFESRTQAFRDDEVLQENVIIHAVKAKRGLPVTITASDGPAHPETVREVNPDELVRPGDRDLFIHILPDEADRGIADLMARFTTTLIDIGLTVSTGRVVDFRSKEYLRHEPGPGTVPLIYPMHFADGWITWPRPGSKKPNAIAVADESDRWLIPAAVHVLVKRFSAKEEKRRIVAAVYDPTRVPAAQVGFENHVNYYHHNGGGLSLDLAKGLTAFLNSTFVDEYFRQFNGHTQVNAADLRNMRYPTREQLETLGRDIGEEFPQQQELDQFIEAELLGMADSNVMNVKRKSDEALAVLKALGMPREQQNERSALTLLALLGLKPDTPWTAATSPMMGITPMMDYFAAHFGKQYAPNSRETVRRFTVHQFEDAGLIVKNPDKPRAVNSPDNVYQIEGSTFDLLKTYGTPEWDRSLAAYLETRKTLQARYAAERVMHCIPVILPGGKELQLSPGGQNVLIKEIIEKFCGYYTPGGEVIYVGDTGDKYAVWDEKALAALGVVTDKHGKMPDVVVYHKAKSWLVLIEAVTSHGPVNAKRHGELKELFKGSKAGLVYVTAFLDRRAMGKYLTEISWETEVWVAEAPEHLIHFNGERFLGPYQGPGPNA